MRPFDDPALLQHTFAKHGTRGTSLNFLALREDPTPVGEKLTVRVIAHAESPPDASVKEGINAIESKRLDAENAVFEQAQGEMNGLTELMLHELEAEIQSRVNTFMGRTQALTHVNTKKTSSNLAAFVETHQQQLPKQANVRVVASDVPYPTVAGLVQDMETRRDIAENLERAKIVELELQLLKVENDMAKEALDRAVERIIAQYESLHPSR